MEKAKYRAKRCLLILDRSSRRIIMVGLSIHTAISSTSPSPAWKINPIIFLICLIKMSSHQTKRRENQGTRTSWIYKKIEQTRLLVKSCIQGPRPYSFHIRKIACQMQSTAVSSRAEDLPRTREMRGRWAWLFKADKEAKSSITTRKIPKIWPPSNLPWHSLLRGRFGGKNWLPEPITTSSVCTSTMVIRR